MEDHHCNQKITMTLYFQCQVSCASSTISTGVVCPEEPSTLPIIDHNTSAMPCRSFMFDISYLVELFENMFQLLKLCYKYIVLHKMLLQNSIIYKKCKYPHGITT